MSKKPYYHLTLEQRCQIFTLRSNGKLQSEIARYLQVSASTISRELKRNSGKRDYRYQQAHKKACNRRSAASCRPYKVTKAIIKRIEKHLRNDQWSPEQIAGRLKYEGVIEISHETIYRHVWADKGAGGDLYKNLRHRGKKYNKRGSKQAGRGLIPNRIDIKERPEIVDRKERFGDFEIDTIIGKNHKGAIVSIVDRCTKLSFFAPVQKKTAAEVGQAIEKLMIPLRKWAHSMTADNGKEFAGHQAISKTLGLTVYFATPYHSWERGLNEHTNGLLRQYLPKKTKFDKVTQKEVKRIQNLLNNRPRKVLGFKTPIEAAKTFIPDLNKIALRC
jgi:IS30 family transposase